MSGGTGGKCWEPGVGEPEESREIEGNLLCGSLVSAAALYGGRKTTE